MITKLLVIQHIKDDAEVVISQVTGDYLQWTFHTDRAKNKKDKNFFPFEVFEEKRIIDRKPGAETKCILTDDQIIFCDDYGVPDGSVISILLPQNYIPDVIKFKDKPFIPVGFTGIVSMPPPGQFQILYNYLEKRSAIVFNIHNKTFFGFKCSAKRVMDDDFPQNESRLVDDFFDVSISQDFLNVEAIQNEDLRIIKQSIDSINVDELKDALNNLLNQIKTQNKSGASKVLKNVSSILVNGAGSTSSLITIADSYKNGGAAFEFIKKILTFAHL